MNIDTIQEQLEQRLQFVEQEVKRLRATRAELQEKLTEPVERGQQEQELSQIDSEIERLEDEGAKLREALGRAKSGAFGMCTSCGKQIESERLDAIPWTQLCIACTQDKEPSA